jgi:predicted AAA+ superfamily ATPase
MHKRFLNIPTLLEKKSFFLFGARATGKSTLIEHCLPDALVINLLHVKTYRSLLANPSLLEEMITDPNKIVVIDEVQKIPEILDEVHRLIQKKKVRFLLTGSNARKLKHGGANLLAGRAREAQFFPLVTAEIESFNLLKLMNHGGLPEIYDSKEPNEDLDSYVNTYLKEEIKAEAVTRNVAAFSEFLDIIGRSNGQEINYESFASDLQTSPGTLKNYFQILDDTLIGFRLPGFTETVKRKATARSKHYLFDLGVAKYLSGRTTIAPKTEEFGDAFEHFIILEMRAYLSYARKSEKMTYWRSTSQMEVDLVVGRSVAIEIKATENPNSRHLKGLKALAEENIFKRFILVYTGHLTRVTEDGIDIVPWQQFTKMLWEGEII